MSLNKDRNIFVLTSFLFPKQTHRQNPATQILRQRRLLLHAPSDSPIRHHVVTSNTSNSESFILKETKLYHNIDVNNLFKKYTTKTFLFFILQRFNINCLRVLGLLNSNLTYNLLDENISVHTCLQCSQQSHYCNFETDIYTGF